MVLGVAEDEPGHGTGMSPAATALLRSLLRAGIGTAGALLVGAVATLITNGLRLESLFFFCFLLGVGTTIVVVPPTLVEIVASWRRPTPARDAATGFISLVVGLTVGLLASVQVVFTGARLLGHDLVGATWMSMAVLAAFVESREFAGVCLVIASAFPAVTVARLRREPLLDEVIVAAVIGTCLAVVFGLVGGVHFATYIALAAAIAVLLAGGRVCDLLEERIERRWTTGDWSTDDDSEVTATWVRPKGTVRDSA